jgi:hypothetical protein
MTRHPGRISAQAPIVTQCCGLKSLLALLAVAALARATSQPPLSQGARSADAHACVLWRPRFKLVSDGSIVKG